MMIERIVSQMATGKWVVVGYGREDGQDMVEYALLGALISIVAIAIILLLGPYIDNLFQDVVNGISST